MKGTVNPEIESRILELRRNGERDASMKLVVEHYYSLIYSLAHRILSNYDDALDASQEALIQIDRSFDQFRGDSRLSTWIYGLTSRVCLRWCRDSHRKTGKNHHDGQSWLGTISAPVSEEPDSVCERRHREKMLEAALQKLPADRRLAIILHDLDGLTVQETASIMEKNIPAVKSMIHRGRSSLRAILGEGFVVPGEEGAGLSTLNAQGLQ